MKRLILFFVIVVVVLYSTHYAYVNLGSVNLVENDNDPNWDSGSVFHILPTVNHNRMLIKVSLRQAQELPPKIKFRKRSVDGVRTDSLGLFWSFDIQGLSPDTQYELNLLTAKNEKLSDPWPLSTFPAPDTDVKKMRLLIYTCAGGHDAHTTWIGSGPIPLSPRIRLLDRALSFDPDAVIASGDHVYYDRTVGRAPKFMAKAPKSVRFAGKFDDSKAVLGTENEEVLKKAVGPQIANLYGTAFRSHPVFFIVDDHDYFENDEATVKDKMHWLDVVFGRSPVSPKGITFPPNKFMLELARASQELYYPEFLPDSGRPAWLPGSSAMDRPEGVSESYGTLRYGKLVEGLMFESRRFVSLKGESGVMIHEAAEEWLINRMKAEEAIHVVNIPATIFGWSAGKWMEWYPDILDKDGKLTTSIDKYLWQPGWFSQHNRLLKAASDMKRSVPLFLCGDMHMQGIGIISRSGNLDLSDNPVMSIATGTIGTNAMGFPSGFRGIGPSVPSALTMKETIPTIEKNGFLIIDFLPKKMVIQFFAWRPPEPEEAIDNLQPYHTLELKIRK